MIGLCIFYQIYQNLGEFCRNKILGNIFGINNVSVSSFSILTNSFIFKLFSNNVFYQFIFIFNYDGDDFVELLVENGIINTKIYIYNYNINDSINKFIKIILCQDEYLVYQMLRRFL